MVDRFPLRIGVVADTHVPDRMSSLHPHLLDELRAQRVERIFHAGDISTATVLAQFEQVAPVAAAFGNRDWELADRIPWVNRLEVGGILVAIMHGHGSWWHYFWDKWVYVAQGYRFERYRKLLVRTAPEARLIVFGHTHHAECAWVGQQLLFNPGSASRGFRRDQLPSFGLLEIAQNGDIIGSIHPLHGYRAEAGEWVKI